MVKYMQSSMHLYPELANFLNGCLQLNDYNGC